MNDIAIAEWYTIRQAAERLTKNSGVVVKPAYVRQLDHIGKIRTTPLDERTKLYYKTDIDAYTVEPRGKKSARAKKAKAKKKERE